MDNYKLNKATAYGQQGNPLSCSLGSDALHPKKSMIEGQQETLEELKEPKRQAAADCQQQGDSQCCIRFRQLARLLHYLGLLRLRHYMRVLLSLALLLATVPANIWIYPIVDSVMVNSGAAAGVKGVSLVNGAVYGASNSALLLTDNATNFEALQAGLLARGTSANILARCGTWPDCRLQFLKRLHATLWDSYTQLGRLDAQGRPVSVECSGGRSHALTCAYFLQLLMRPLGDNDSEAVAAAEATAFKEAGFFRYVVPESSDAGSGGGPPPMYDGEELADSSLRSDFFGAGAGRQKLPETPCTRSESAAIFSAVSHLHALLLLTALAVLLLVVDLFPLCSLRRAGFLRLLCTSGLHPDLAWLSGCLWGLAECALVGLAVALCYQAQCPGVLDADRFWLACLAVTGSALHYLACGMLAAACSKFAYVALVMLLLHLVTLSTSFSVYLAGFSGGGGSGDGGVLALARLLLALLLPGSQLASMLEEVALPAIAGGQPDPMRSENIRLLALAHLSACLLSLAALYADTSRQSGPRGSGGSASLCCYPLRRLFWRGRSACNAPRTAEEKPLLDAPVDYFEKPDPSWRATVRARGLCQVYPGSASEHQTTSGDTTKGGGSAAKVKALDNFSAEIYHGQITALIGPNGSGKSTLIRLLAGDELPQAGSAFVSLDGDRSFHLTDPLDRLGLAESIGVCYQENVLCESLTVWESVLAVLVSRGRDGPQDRQACKQMLKRLGLGSLRSRLATDLSGGQQRKLCAVLALAGDPAFVLLDEPTSGLDPLSRRALWSLLAEGRKSRCLLLSTQFMDEADLLADRKLLLRDGRLRCAGSSLFIKEKFKCFCIVHVAVNKPSAFANQVKSKFGPESGVAVADVGPHEVAITSPKSHLVAVATWLEECKKASEGKTDTGQVIVSNFGLSLTGLDSVFEQRGKSADQPEVDGGSETVKGQGDAAATDTDTAAATAAATATDAAADTPPTVKPKPVHDAKNLCEKGVNTELKRTALGQFNALMRLNLRRLQHDRCRLLCRLLVPLLLLVVFLCLLGFERARLASPPNPPRGLRSMRRLDFSLYRAGKSVSGVCLLDAGGVPPSRNECDWLHTNREFSYMNDIKVLVKPANMSLADYLTLPKTRSTIQRSCSYADQCPLVYADTWNRTEGFSNSRRTVYVGYYFSQAVSSGMSNIERLINSYVRVAQYFNISLAPPPSVSRSLPASPSDAALNASASGSGSVVRNPLSEAVYVDPVVWALILLVSVIPVGILADPVEDRAVGLRSQLRAMGVSPLGYWASTWLLHWIQYLLFCMPACVAMTALLPHTYANAYFLVGVFPVLLLLGLPANQLLVYLASTWVKRPNALATGLLFIASFACGLAPLLVEFSNWIGLLLCLLWPPYAVVGLPFYASKAAANAAEFYNLPGGAAAISKLLFVDIYASNPLLLLCLVCVPVHSLALAGLLAAREAGWVALLAGAAQRCLPCLQRFVSRNRDVEFGTRRVQPDNASGKCKASSSGGAREEADSALPPKGSAVDPDEDFSVRKERQRLLSTRPIEAEEDTSDCAAHSSSGQHDTVQVLQLAKHYPGRTDNAVADVTFGASAGQIFGLLGPNGAGKSTTLSVLVGERSASDGRCMVKGLSGRDAARLGHIGYCPQYSPLLPDITVREHLKFYARVRGLSPDAAQTRVASVASELGLKPFIDRPAIQLSGGNRRRLCLAIALLGDPAVLVIDEASTGVDPENKRAIWRAVRQVASGQRAVVLTTHSMEEAEALCSKVGIMHEGRLLAVGSNQEMRSRYGASYTLDVQLKRASTAGATDSDKVDADISIPLKSVFTNQNLQEDFGAWARYQVTLPAQPDALSQALSQLESHPLVESYALYQSSLDQIFYDLLDKRVKTAEDCAVAADSRAYFLVACMGCGRGDDAERRCDESELATIPKRTPDQIQ